MRLCRDKIHTTRRRAILPGAALLFLSFQKQEASQTLQKQAADLLKKQMRQQRNDKLCGRSSPIKFGQADKTRNSKAIIRTWKQYELRNFYKDANNLLFYNATILFQISNPKRVKRRNRKYHICRKNDATPVTGNKIRHWFCHATAVFFLYKKSSFPAKPAKRNFSVLYIPGRLKNTVCFYMSFFIISRATTTPVTDACIKPRVIPAPSPIAYRLRMEVSKLFATSSFEE